MNELVIHGGVVHDELGSRGAQADVAFAAGRVVAIGRDVGPGRRVIDAGGRFVTPGGIVGWEKAIRKATSATALQFDLAHRGTLQPGSIADICVFDPETIAHPGSYAEPSVTPVGIDHVLLAGSIVVENGEFTGARDGHVLRA